MIIYNTDTMSANAPASRIRQRVAHLSAHRSHLERGLLRRRQMLAASLIQRHLGTRQQKRKSRAFYLSWAPQGRTILVYVPQGRIQRVRREVQAWREFRKLCRDWKKLGEQMSALFDQLGHVQARKPVRETR